MELIMRCNGCGNTARFSELNRRTEVVLYGPDGTVEETEDSDFVETETRHCAECGGADIETD